jgi:hypothetical protein
VPVTQNYQISEQHPYAKPSPPIGGSCACRDLRTVIASLCGMGLPGDACGQLTALELGAPPAGDQMSGTRQDHNSHSCAASQHNCRDSTVVQIGGYLRVGRGPPLITQRRSVSSVACEPSAE